MNTVKSVYYGWGSLIVAGGGAYYFAKKSINAGRAEKAEVERQKRVRQHQLELSHGLLEPASNPTISPNAVVAANTTARPAPSDKGALASDIRASDRAAHADASGNPSLQANADPAATRHAPETEGQDKSKYEASAAYRTRKGDRFS